MKPSWSVMYVNVLFGIWGRRLAVVEAPSLNKVVCTSVASILEHKSGSLVEFDGFLLDMVPSKTVGKDKDKDNKHRKVLAVIIGDAGAVVQVNFWTPAAEQVESLLRKPFEEEDQFVRVHVVGAEIVELAARPQRVVRLQSTKQTAVQVRGAAGVVITPVPQFVLRDFSKLEATDGEVAVVSGHVTHLSAVRQARSGASMRSFLLVDADGIGIPIMMHGQGCLNPDLVHGAHLLMYWVCALEPLQIQDENDPKSGHYWCYQEHYCLYLPDQKADVVVVEEKHIF